MHLRNQYDSKSKLLNWPI